MDVRVRYDEKDATVRYLPGKVTLDTILKRYDSTPFTVTPAGPVVTIARAARGTIRGWTERLNSAGKDEETPETIQLFVEVAAPNSTELKLSLADPPAKGLAQLEEFHPTPKGFTAKLNETVALGPREITIPVSYEPGKKLAVVWRATAKGKKTDTVDATATGVALIGGTLDLQLGHLCDQKGCVTHFHQSLSDVDGIGAVRPHPDMEKPRATVYLRAGRPIDLWSLREKLRSQSIEVTGMVPRDLESYRLRIELPRWRAVANGARGDDADHGGSASAMIEQCVVCRERVLKVLGKLEAATDVAVAGGGINCRVEGPGRDAVTLLNKVTDSGATPSAVWLVPDGVRMPKAATPLDTQPHAQHKTAGSDAHPIIEFELPHTCGVGTTVASLLHQQDWASETQVDVEDITIARTLIADRKFGKLTPLLTRLRSAGHSPQAIRLREFGDIRIQLEFAHICGEVVLSKPPKPKRGKEKDKKPNRPFVPQPVSMADTSNGRKAIQAAIESVGWVKDGRFFDYHTRFAFRGGPRKITFAMQAADKDVVRLDELIDALRTAGFPPTSIVVSRQFPGIPFGKPLPRDLQLTNRDGTKTTLAAFKKPDRPLAVAFVSLKTLARDKYKKYKADPKLYARFGKTIERYKDRVDVVAVSANKDDKFEEVVEFWRGTGLTTPLLHDRNGTARAVFNVQITPPPHLFVFDAEGLLRYGGDPHSNWEKPDKEHDDFLAKALDLVIARKYLDNGAVFYNKSVCNCSHPGCRCPKCGCGSTCRCAIKHCRVGF